MVKTQKTFRVNSERTNCVQGCGDKSVINISDDENPIFPVTEQTEGVHLPLNQRPLSAYTSVELFRLHHSLPVFISNVTIKAITDQNELEIYC